MKTKQVLLLFMAVFCIAKAKAQFLYGTANKDEHLVSTVLTPDGGFINLANTGTKNEQDILIYRVSNTGNLIWQRRYGNGNGWRDNAVKLIATSDNNYVFAGTVRTLWPSDNTKSIRTSFVQKIDINGNDIWANPLFLVDHATLIPAYPLSNSSIDTNSSSYDLYDNRGDLIRNICEVDSGKIACVGIYHWGYKPSNAMFTIVDKNGNELLTNRLGLATTQTPSTTTYSATEYFGVNYDTITHCIIATGICNAYDPATPYGANFTYLPLATCYNNLGHIGWSAVYRYYLTNSYGDLQLLHWAYNSEVLNGKIYYTIANTDDYNWTNSALYNILTIDEMNGSIMDNREVNVSAPTGSFYNYGSHITKVLPNKTNPMLTDLFMIHTPTQNYDSFMNAATVKKMHTFLIPNYPTDTTNSGAGSFGRQYVRAGSQRFSTYTTKPQSNFVYIGGDFVNDTVQGIKNQSDNGILQISSITGKLNVGTCLTDTASTVTMIPIDNTTDSLFSNAALNIQSLYPFHKTGYILVKDTPNVTARQIFCTNPCVNKAGLQVSVLAYPNCSNNSLTLQVTANKPQINFRWTENNNVVGTVITTTATSQTIVISNPAGSHTYVVTSEDSTCPTKDFAFFAIALGNLPRPTKLITTNITRCADTGTAPTLLSAVNAASIGSGNTLLWYTDTTQAGSTTIPTYNATVAGVYTFYVAQKNTSGCISYRSKIVVTINANPVITLQPTITSYRHCADTSIVLHLNTNVANPDILWTINNISTNSNDSSIVVPITTDNDIYYSVLVIGATGCSTESVQKKITVTPCYTQCNFENAGNLDTAISRTILNATRYFTNPNVNITIPTGTVKTMVNTEILMGDNARIIVPDGATLVLQGCHLYSCNAMWRGIKIEQGGTLVVDAGGSKSNSFIEDADTAISVNTGELCDSNKYRARPYNFILSATKTIFNRNNIGIALNNINGFSTLDPSYIQIANCIFTSRDIPFNTGTTVNWVSNNDLMYNPSVYTSCSTAPATLVSPYINSNVYSATNFGSMLKLGNNKTTKPTAGIVINGQMFRNGSITIGTTAIASNNGCNTTLFDNLGYGIFNTGITTASALSVRNCSFQNGVATGNNKQGVLQSGIGFYSLRNYSNMIDISTPANGKRNAFYNMQYAIKTIYCNKVNVNNVFIASTQSIANTSNGNGKWGIFTQGRSYDSININNNTIINIANPIKVDAATGIVSSSIITNSININGNTIQDALPNTTCSSCYVLNGITLAGTIATTNKTTPVNIKTNNLNGVFNGIAVTGLKAKNSVDSGNIINLKTYAISGVAKPQYGIAYGGSNAMDSNKAATSLGQIIRDNIITGSCNTCNQTGIYAINQTNTHIACNSVNNLVHGVKFKGKNIATRFWNNTMLKNNVYGLTLDNAIIGQQGDDVRGLRTKYCTSDNYWEADTSSWINQTPPHYRIACINGADATKSPLYVQNTGNYNPENATFTNGQSLTIPYNTANQSILVKTAGTLSTSCWRLCASQSSDPYLMPDDVNPQDLETLEGIAAQDESEATTPEELDAINVAKQQLYDFLQANPEMMNYSSILEQFMLNNQYATLDYSGLVNAALNNKEYQLANTLLNTWQVNSTPDANNLFYYTWQYNMAINAEYLPDANEVFAIANQCPLTGGNIVFDARNLYNALIEDNIMFEDDCTDASPMLRKKNTKTKPVVDYKLSINVYPNPTKGYVYIDLPNTNKPCWQITVTDIMGKQVTTKTIRSNIAKTFVELQGSKGIYFVKVFECNSGKQEVKKVILE